MICSCHSTEIHPCALISASFVQLQLLLACIRFCDLQKGCIQLRRNQCLHLLSCTRSNPVLALSLFQLMPAWCREAIMRGSLPYPLCCHICQDGHCESFILCPQTDATDRAFWSTLCNGSSDQSMLSNSFLKYFSPKSLSYQMMLLSLLPVAIHLPELWFFFLSNGPCIYMVLPLNMKTLYYYTLKLLQGMVCIIKDCP